jgi:ABC-2 type transport system permease protein
MSSLATVRLIAAREVRQKLRSKLFVGTSLALGALLGALAALPIVLGTFDTDREPDPVAEDGEPAAVVIVGELTDVEREALHAVLGPVEERTVTDEADAERAVLEDEEVALAIVPGDRVIAPRSGGFFQLAGQGEAVAEALAVARLLEEAGAGGAVEAVLTAPPLEIDQIGAQDPAEATARLVVANLGVVFLFAVLIMYSSMIINGVIEEKGSRVIELLIEAVPARQLMTGKVLGLGVVGLGQTLVIFGPAALVLSLGARALVPPGVGALAWLIVLWFVLGYAFYAVIAAGFGALVSRPEEAQAVLVPANVLMITGYLVGFIAVNAPDATFARVFGWLPPTAPYVMLVRQTLGSPTVGEVLGSLALMLVAIVGATLLAARLYRGGILRLGARVRFREAWRGETS